MAEVAVALPLGNRGGLVELMNDDELVPVRIAAFGILTQREDAPWEDALEFLREASDDDREKAVAVLPPTLPESATTEPLPPAAEPGALVV